MLACISGTVFYVSYILVCVCVTCNNLQTVENVFSIRESLHTYIIICCCCPGPDIPGFLLQPFRKPKRIRTAFSPSQLLKLEHAFEKNHYVVGAERKQLAQSLSLTETQVRQLSLQFLLQIYNLDF